MQIKTITCHQVYNQGATLQEYALLYFLNTNGFEAKTIRYKPHYFSHHFNLLCIRENSKYNKPLLKQLYILAKLPRRLQILKQRKVFDQFAEKYIPSDSTIYTSNEELKADLPLADAYICGSDQIWNSLFENGKDAAFFLDFVPIEKLKISYAASFATETIPRYLKPFVREKVKRINQVSVRETSALTILKDLGINNAIQVLDPVFLLDSDHWVQFVTPFREPFILVYDFDCNPVMKEMALEYKSKNNVKIFTINQDIKYADKNFFTQGPETFLSLIKGADFIFTNSFHAVAFSFIFKKQFAVFDRNEKINTRMRDLVGMFNVKNVITEKIEIFELPYIDYLSIAEALNFEIQKSKNFLLEIRIQA